MNTDTNIQPLDEMKSLLQQIQWANRELVKDYQTASTEIKTLGASHQKLSTDFAEAQKHLEQLRRGTLGATSARMAHQAVTDDCARYIAALVVCGADSMGGLSHIKGAQRDALVGECKNILGLETRSALTTSDIPLPTMYSQQIVELVWKYGQARQYTTVYPLGQGTTKLPQLKTSPTFGFIAQSASVAEKSPQIQFVTFNPQKAGGLVRIPSEIDADSIVPLGQFLARYIAREMARWEDTVLFLADGTGTYNSLKGVGQTAIDNSLVLQLATSKTKPTDITMTDVRNLRAKVNAAALFSGAYYFHPSMEALLRSYNAGGNSPFVVNPNGQATFDGFPIRWVGVLPVYDGNAHTSQVQGAFGDLSYWYFGERSSVSIETSREVYFATDELAVRALERFTVQLMATDAVAALQLAAS
ncbi:MAG: Major capsid protein [Verrucomicrobiales bacterium]|nr:Major capsid protein [Verrucomicrobiales bacterium]